MKCRNCQSQKLQLFVDLGFSPPSNAYLDLNGLTQAEEYYPLKVFVCSDCWLVQTEDFAKKEKMFDERYAYFSSVSKSWLDHSRKYVHAIIEKLNIDQNKFVVEVASNDGYLLKNFIELGIKCLGIEPTKSTADACRSQGIPVLSKFFGKTVGQEIVIKYRKADLIICNNVYAHVPDIKDFTEGLKDLLAESGTVTIEFPHFLELLIKLQFDTIYHEHFSYLSLYTVSEIFEKSNLKIYDVEKIGTHGGSLRVYGCHKNADYNITESVINILNEEKLNKLNNLQTYESFKDKTQSVKIKFLLYLLEKKVAGKKVVGYGAAAKGVALLNYSGVGSDLIECIYDASPSKIGLFTPGGHIPIKDPKELSIDNPDVVIVFPWNISNEINDVIKKLISKDILCVIIKDGEINETTLMPIT